MNITVPIVEKNVDVSILAGTVNVLRRGKQSLIHNIDAYVALGELKGGIDPAGADEHWKTANSALNRIRKGFSDRKKKPFTFFVGAAIENSMASEIFKQLQSGSLDNAANLTNDEQLASICEWIINL
jgi:type II restriction enzyme